MGNRDFDAIYQNAPRHQVDELLEFRSTHPVQQRSIDGIEWHYILSGTGSETILIVSGLTGTAETAYKSILNLEKDYRVLSLSYPPYTEMDKFLDGLVKLLDLEGIRHVHFRGGSLGAGVGHLLVRRHPDRVNKLVLSSFGLYGKKKLWQVKQFVRLFNFLPYWLISKYYRIVLPQLLTEVEESKRSFYLAYMNDLLDLQNSKKILMSQYRMMLDMFENPSYNLSKQLEVNCVLIFQGENDTGFNRNEQAAFRQTYPNANIHIFAEAGHFAGITYEDEQNKIIREFLAS
jgi:pimeloyl-ACP methyl ester carboxylesterase